MGWHTLVAPDGKEHRVYSGNWLGGRGCGRFDCHPREEQTWRRTAHASIFRRGIEGELRRGRGRYDPTCFGCHAVGYQPGAPGLGLDERIHESGWRFPKQLEPGNWLAMPAEVRRLANRWANQLRRGLDGLLEMETIPD